MASLRSWSRRSSKRPPALLHREQPARHHDHRRRARRAGEVLRKTVGIDGGRGHDHLQVGPPRQDLPQVAEQEVDVQAALVRLVDDQRVVGPQQRVALRLGQQDAVGHQLDARARLQPVLEAHLVAHHLAQRRVQLLRRCAWPRELAAMRRGCVWPISPLPPAPRPRPSSSTIFGSCVVLPEPVSPQTMTTWCSRNGARDLVAPAGDRQRFGVGDRRDGVRRAFAWPGAPRGSGGWVGHGPRIIRAARHVRSCAAVRAVLHDAEHRALRVLQSRPCGRRRARPSGRHHDLAAQRHGLRRGGVGVGHRRS